MPSARMGRSPVPSRRSPNGAADHHATRGPKLLLGLLSLVVIAGLVGRRALLVGNLPPGLDGGQWLAIGRGLLGGEGRSTNGVYAPLVPLVTAGLARLVGPLDAVRLVALGSYAILVVAIAIVAGQSIGGFGGVAIAATMGSAGIVNEPLAFGGYPQQTALAALLIAAAATAQLGRKWSRRNFAIVIAALTVAALTHHVYFPLALAVVAAECLLAVAIRAPTIRRSLPGLGASALVSTVIAWPTLSAFRRFGYAPPVDGSRFSIVEAWTYGAREASTLWLVIVIVGTIGLLVAPPRHRGSTWIAATATLVVGGITFLLSAQVRVLPLVLFGGLLGLAFGVNVISNSVKTVSSAILTPVVLTIIAALIVIPGDRVTREFVAFYQVLDSPLVASASRIQSMGRPVAVRADRRGWPIGWWVEGLTTVPVAVGSDARWLGFPDEQRKATAVATLFDGSLNPAQIRKRAQAADISLLLVRKWEWIGWERWLASDAPAVAPVVDTDELLLLQIQPPP